MKSIYAFLCISLMGMSSLSAQPLSKDNEKLLAKAANCSLGLACALRRAADEAQWNDQLTHSVFTKLIAIHKKSKKEGRENKIQELLWKRYWGTVVKHDPKILANELIGLCKGQNFALVSLVQKARLANIQ